MPVMKQLRIGSETYDTVGEASVTQVQTSGTKIATVTIDGTATDLYAPEGGSSIDPATTAPSMDGTAAAGTSTDYARADHVHPTDTSRLAGITLNTSAEPYDVPVSNSTAEIDIGDGLKVDDSYGAELSVKFGTTAKTVAAGNHTHSGYQPTLVSGTSIKTINGESILGSGNIATPTYTLPEATTSTLGGVKVDGTTITATDGVISAVGGGGGSNGMLITVNYSSSSYVADKTAQEIYDALEAGVMPVIKVTGAYYPLTHVYVSGTRLELRFEGFAGEFVANTMTDYPTLSGSSGGSND